MHWIQRDILKTLSSKDKVRYRDLKPENVEGNLFMYHLKILITDGYIENRKRKYQLTSTGKSYVAGLSLSSGQPTKIPRIFATLYCKNRENQILLYKWNRQPYLG
ncbi:MAG: hypothetical protein PHW75_03570, partial [Patescibacteria group bacterium]|nr:hypothetical protein [Patescibacteria group bacterium]